MTQEEFNEKMRLHKMFQQGNSNGERAIFDYQDLRGIVIRGLDFSRASLYKTIFVWADIEKCRFRKADTYKAHFIKEDLSKRDSDYVIWTGAYVLERNNIGKRDDSVKFYWEKSKNKCLQM